MNILVQIPTGDLIDKITILEIKIEKITDGAKRANVARELEALTAALPPALDATAELAHLRRDLKAVNAKLWRIEDDIRGLEREQRFGEPFIALARAVYTTNDRRAALKRRINVITASGLIEEKSYAAY